MGIRADQTYTALVVVGSRLFESTKNKTPGFQVNLECEEGPISYIIWITSKNRERAARDFEILGVDVANLASRNYLLYQLPTEIVGRKISFGTKTEVYQGEERVKVSWIGKVGAGNEETIASSVASIFGGQTPIEEAPLVEDDIPF